MLSPQTKRFLKHHAPVLVKTYRDWRTARRLNDGYWDRRMHKVLNLVDDLEKNPFSSNIPEKYEKLEKRPTHAVVEINNTCNINCIMCQTQSSTRKKGRMTQGLLSHILDELKEAGIKTVALHTLGDPLANPRLAEVLSELRKRMMFTSICTNGLLLYRHIDALIEYMDICPSIAFSIDGANQDTYERIRLGGKWSDLLRNLDLYNEKLRPRGMTLRIHMTVSKDNIHEVGDFIEKFRPYVDYPSQDIDFHLITGLAPDNTYFHAFNLFPNHTHKNIMCFRPQGDPLWFNVDGNVSACCRDYHGELYVGDIQKQNFDQIMSGEGLRKLQKAHESRDLSEYPPCDTCFRPDKRLDEIFNSVIQFFVHKHPDASNAYYQGRVDELRTILQSNGKYREKFDHLIKN